MQQNDYIDRSEPSNVPSRRTVLESIPLAGVAGTAGCLFGANGPGYTDADIGVDNDDDDETHTVHLGVTRGRTPEFESRETPTDPAVEEYDRSPPFVAEEDTPRRFDVEVRPDRRQVVEDAFERRGAYHVEGRVDDGSRIEHVVHDFGGRLSASVSVCGRLSFGVGDD